MMCSGRRWMPPLRRSSPDVLVSMQFLHNSDKCVLCMFGLHPLVAQHATGQVCCMPPSCAASEHVMCTQLLTKRTAYSAAAADAAATRPVSAPRTKSGSLRPTKSELLQDKKSRTGKTSTRTSKKDGAGAQKLKCAVATAGVQNFVAQQLQ